MKKRAKLSLHRETIVRLEKAHGAGTGPTANSCESVCWCEPTYSCNSCYCGTDQLSVCVCV